MSHVSKYLSKIGKNHYVSGKQFIMGSPPVKVYFMVPSLGGLSYIDGIY